MPANPGKPLRAVAGARRSVGEVLTAKEIAYFVVAPIFGISSPKCAWLNEVQSVSKMVEIKEGPSGYDATSWAKVPTSWLTPGG